MGKIVIKAAKRDKELTSREKGRLKIMKILNQAKKRIKDNKKLSSSQELALEGRRFVNFAVGIEDFEQFMDNMCSEKSPNEVFAEWINQNI